MAFVGWAHRAGAAVIPPVHFPVGLDAPRSKVALAGLSVRPAGGGTGR
jgi:hypothetical protein